MEKVLRGLAPKKELKLQKVYSERNHRSDAFYWYTSSFTLHRSLFSRPIDVDGMIGKVHEPIKTRLHNFRSNPITA